MITLFLLRHAHAGDPARWSGDDGLRPLTDKGRRQAERVGNLLAAADESPDLVVTSPLVRAEETARIVAAALDVPIVVDRRLVGPLYAEEVQDILAAFSSMLGELIGVAVVPMRKGALARVDFEGHVRSGRGTLRFLVPPEILSGR